MEQNDKNIENKFLKAVAIQKNLKGTDNVPRVIATGYGSIARRIIDIAKKNDIDIEEGSDKEIIKWEITGFIPDQTYAVVSEILSFVYKINEEEKNK
ncbi:MAG: EscU/YscU/HrcU family type III secretion system export apparatus switch protein [Armatimonadota bacterium]